jgi:2-polyprenyl-6-methoxyphenol hydroxylase-like FAD-dependent oxidoreductase
MTSEAGRVLVAGAGIGGLALARALQRRGIDVLVLDRLSGPPDAGLGLNLPGNGVRAFAELGIGDELGKLGRPVRRREYRGEKDRILFAVDEDAFWGEGGGSRCVRRQDLLDALGSGLPPGSVRWNAAVASIQPGPDGVGVRLADGGVERGGLRRTPQWLRSTFAAFPAPVPQIVDAVLAEPASLYHSPIEEVRIARWSAGRVVLLGDAAHATAPVWAQGAAMAAEDAIVLADVLAGSSDWSQVGIEYERRRRSRVEHVQTMTDRLSKTAAIPIWIRNRILPKVGPRTYAETYDPLRTLP